MKRDWAIRNFGRALCRDSVSFARTSRAAMVPTFSITYIDRLKLLGNNFVFLFHFLDTASLYSFVGV